MPEYNSEKVKKTLSLVASILEKHKVEYRVLGSVATAAIIGKQHRALGDIDLLVDAKKKDLLLNELIKNGYFHRKGIFAFGRKYLNLISLDHDSLLEVGFFFGSWMDGSFVMGSQRNGIMVDNKAVKKTEYTLHGIAFIGLPQSVVARGVLMSSKNPKRQSEVSFFKQKRIEPMSKDYIHTYIMGMKVDFVYYFIMQILNGIGFIRVKLGKSFDLWR